MKYLAIDTSGDLIVTVFDGEKHTTKYLKGCNTKHSLTLMPYVEECLSEQKLTLEQLDFIAAVVGPGSFTGIRIGVATAKALCFASDKPLLSLTSFDLLAYSDNVNQKCICLIDANHDNYYLCAYQNRVRVGEAKFMAIGQILAEYPDYQIVSNNSIEGVNCQVADLVSGLKNAVNALNENRAHHEQCFPLYVKKSQAEEERC